MRIFSTLVVLSSLLAACTFSDDDSSLTDVVGDTQSADTSTADTRAPGDADPHDSNTHADTQILGEIELPRDEAPHSSSIEWWYYTGLLTTSDGRRYGFEQVVFQLMVVGTPAYMAHFAISDLQSLAFTTAMQTGFVDQRAAVEVGFSLEVGGWTMTGHRGHDRTSFATDTAALELSFTPLKPAVAQYGDGAMTLGSDEPFYYYSYTRMAAAGILTLGDEALEVTGEAWMDHQWGEIGTGTDGWDWYSLRFDDNTELMLFAVREPAGNQFGGTFIHADGTPSDLQPDDIVVEAFGSWHSPHTNRVYPMGWEVRIPSQQLEATVTPVFDDQEFTHTFGESPIYWEGVCDVSGERAGVSATGYAYVELVNYPVAE